jgi:hypothetical protein
MNVELIQKINNLAVDLMKQGLAQNREDAINQAEKILKGSDSADYSELRETSCKIIAEKQEEPVKEKIPEKELDTNQINKILEQNTKFMVKTIKQFQDKIYALEKEMSELRNKIAYNKLPTVNDVITGKIGEPKIEDAREIPPIETEENSENHPRVGNFEAEDVSIEKFFYMGSK